MCSWLWVTHLKIICMHCDLQVVVVLQQVFALIQTVLSQWLNDSQVVEVRHRSRWGSQDPWANRMCSQIPTPCLYLKCDFTAPPIITCCRVGIDVYTCVPQAVCAIFEKSVKTLLHDFAPMVSQLSEMLGQMYSTIPQASALDLTRQVLTHWTT